MRDRWRKVRRHVQDHVGRRIRKSPGHPHTTNSRPVARAFCAAISPSTWIFSGSHNMRRRVKQNAAIGLPKRRKFGVGLAAEDGVLLIVNLVRQRPTLDVGMHPVVDGRKTGAADDTGQLNPGHASSSK